MGQIIKEHNKHDDDDDNVYTFIYLNIYIHTLIGTWIFFQYGKMAFYESVVCPCHGAIEIVVVIIIIIIIIIITFLLLLF